MAKIPWEEIKQEYITTTIGQRPLAEKYGISVPSLNSHSKAGNWVQLRKEYMQKKLEGPQEQTERQEVEMIPGEGYFVLDLGPEAEDLKPRQRYRLYKLKLKNIPIYDQADPIQVRNRIDSYFTFCDENDISMSPADLAKWLKISSSSLRRWRNGEYRSSTHQKLIEDAWDNIEADLINSLRTGTISPPSGIFLLKNWFNYKDVQDLVVAPKNPLGELQDKKALEERIMGTVVVEDFSVPDSPQKSG